MKKKFKKISIVTFGMGIEAIGGVLNRSRSSWFGHVDKTEN